MPLRDWLGSACGVLNWTPETFWKSTPIEYFSAVKAFNDFNSSSSGKPVPATQDDLDYLMQKYPDKS